MSEPGFAGVVWTDAEGYAEVTLPHFAPVVAGRFRYELKPQRARVRAVIAAELTENRFAIQTDGPQVEVAWRLVPLPTDGLVPFTETAARRAIGRRSLVRTLPIVLVALVVGAAAALPAHSSASKSVLQPEALTQARAIRAEVNARYRWLPGRKLAVTEATTTGVVKSITLITDEFESSRVVRADNGIYFAICSARAKCPYPVRSAAWPAMASPPRRIALELALRTFVETSVSLVVVALPTVRPVWVVFERDDLLATLDTPAIAHQLASNAAVIDLPLRELIDRLTRAQLFLPLPILPPPDDTIYALQVVSD